MSRRAFGFLILRLALAAILAGCASAPPNGWTPVQPVVEESPEPESRPDGMSGGSTRWDAEEKPEPPLQRDSFSFLDVPDPLEPLNRNIYAFNTVMDDYVMEPVVRWYEKIVPLFARDRISHFFSNLGDLSVMLNCFLQGKAEKGGMVLGRFMVNSTVGVLGMWDPATGEGLPKYNEDFGQTLAVYGVGPGPYLMLPILGPSNLRDVGGKIFDGLAKSTAVGVMDIDLATDTALSVVDSLEYRASMPFAYGDFDSPFEYEMVRLLYTDTRNLLIHDGSFVERHYQFARPETLKPAP